jgi:peptidyl-prolyl cis-trans isomerase C
MNKLLLSLILASLATFAVPALSADSAQAEAGAEKAADNGPVATVNGVAIPAIDAEVVHGDLARSGRKATDEDVRNILINNELLSQEAIRLGLDKPAEVQALLDLQRKDMLGKLLMQHFAKSHTISDERVQAEYDKFKAKVGDTEYHSRHILVDNEELAKEIIKKLEAKKPAKFEDLAKKYSKDPGSAAKGGDLGWMAPASLVPEFSEAMTHLKKDEFTKEPVKTKFGWHVIQLLDTRKLDLPTFEQLKGRISNKLMQEDLQAYLAELRSNAKIEIPAPAEAPAAKTDAPATNEEAPTAK